MFFSTESLLSSSNTLQKPGIERCWHSFLLISNAALSQLLMCPLSRKTGFRDKVRDSGRLARLPTEIVDQIVKDVDEFPISMKEAKELRLKLMEGTKVYAEVANEEIEHSLSYSFEHLQRLKGYFRFKNLQSCKSNENSRRYVLSSSRKTMVDVDVQKSVRS